MMPSITFMVYESQTFCAHPAPALKQHVLINIDDTCVHDIDGINYWKYEYLCEFPRWIRTNLSSIEKPYTLEEYLERFCTYDEKMKKYIYSGDNHVKQCCVIA